jgi:hypothetical protein
MRDSSNLSYDEFASKVVELDKSFAHLSREERDIVVREELGISLAVLREVRGERDLLEFGG